MTSKEIKQIIRQFDKVSILVIGDLMLDRYLSGQMTRISPEAPAPLIDIYSESFQLGGAANAINAISSLGGNVRAVGVVGDDWYGNCLIKLLKQEDVDTNGVIEISNRSTTVKTRIMSGQQQILRFDRENRDLITDEFTSSILDYLHENISYVDGILISNYNKGVITQGLLYETINLAKEYNKPIIVYPKIDHFLDYRGVTLFITDLDTASSVTGIRQINETSIRNMGHWLLSHLECEYVLLIRGEYGMSLFEKNGDMTNLPPVAKELRNVTGTADTIASVIALSLVPGFNMIDSASLANIAAGIILEKPGRIALTRDELERQMENIP